MEKTIERSHLKDDATFALLTIVFPHTIAMLNKLDNLPRLDAIWMGNPFVLKICASWQHGSNIGDSNSRGNNRS